MFVLNHDGKETTYENFEEAIGEFLKIVKKYLWENSDNNKENGSTVYGYSCDPFSLGVYFHTKYDNRTITDEEIALEARLGMLLDYFLSGDKKQIQDNAIKTIKQSINYHGNDDLRTKVGVDINLKSDELVLNINIDNGFESYIRSNAFIFEDESKTYYFMSKQFVEVSNNPDDLGRAVELNISLSEMK